MRHTDYIKRSKVKVVAGGRRHISHTNEGKFAQLWSQTYLHS